MGSTRMNRSVGAASWGGFKQAGSLTVSVDTRFGPLFFAAGTTRGTGSALYLSLGPFG